MEEPRQWSVEKAREGRRKLPLSILLAEEMG